MPILRFYGSATEATGVSFIQIPAHIVTVDELRHFLKHEYPEIAPILAVATITIDNTVVTEDDTSISLAHEIDILPPFAGG